MGRGMEDGMRWSLMTRPDEFAAGGNPLGIRQDRAQRGAVELSKASWVPSLI